MKTENSQARAFLSRINFPVWLAPDLNICPWVDFEDATNPQCNAFYLNQTPEFFFSFFPALIFSLAWNWALGVYSIFQWIHIVKLFSCQFLFFYIIFFSFILFSPLLFSFPFLSFLFFSFIFFSFLFFSFILFYFTLLYFILFYFILFYFILFYFILF